MSLKEKLGTVLCRVRNPERDENEKAFMQKLGFKRLIFFLPFLIVAAVFMLLSLK